MLSEASVGRRIAGVQIPPDVEAEIIRMYQGGAPRSEIREAVGCGNGTITSALERNGVPLRVGRRPLAPEKDPEVVRLYLAGVSRAQIVAQTGVPNGTISHILKRNGVDRDRARRAPVAAEIVEAIRNLYLEGKSYTEIANTLGISHGSVSGLIHRKKITRADSFRAENVRRAAQSRAPRLKAAAPAPKPKFVAVASSDDTRVLMVPEAEVEKFTAREAEPTVLTAADDPVVKLRALNCKWPIGNPGKPGFRFCCAIKLGAGPYCPEHERIAYRPATKSDENALASIKRWA